MSVFLGDKWRNYACTSCARENHPGE
jgi:hypothetical protein